MYDFRGFPFLEVGRRVKVKGLPATDGTFAALEITVNEPDEQTEVQGLIQQIEQEQGRLHLANLTVVCPEELYIRYKRGDEANFADLQPGALVKIQGRSLPDGGFAPAQVEIQPKRDFNLEQLQGAIEQIDAEHKTFKIIGATVLVNRKTSIEVLPDSW
jgi:hypothetical protein